jgi:hypothetical protein
MLHLADAPAGGTVPVALEHGVRELVAARAASSNGGEIHPSTWHTCFVEFDRRAGWHRERPEEWLRRHLGVRDPGRTIRLDVPYRMHPHLAAFLADCLFGGGYDLPSGVPAHLAGLVSQPERPPVQFIPVPLPIDSSSRRRDDAATARATSGRRSATATAVAPARGGAGLEVDAAEPRHRDRLPLELRQGLNHRGFVNYLEAQAVVRVLQGLVADPALRAAGARQAAEGQAQPVIGVLALYPAQAELIRRLMEQVPALAAPEVSVKVDVPAAFREGECLIGLISLTRSHSHRAVSYGEGPHLLVRALTRARARLILFGDPGTLARRSQWEAPLDHLDEAASAWEQAIMSRLVDYLHGHGTHGSCFQLGEGCST